MILMKIVIVIRTMIIFLRFHTGTRHAIIRKAHRYKLTSGIEIPSSIRPRERLIRENVPRGPNVGARDLGSDLIPIHLPVHLHLHLHRHLSLFISKASISLFCFLRRAARGATGYRGGLTSASARGIGHLSVFFISRIIIIIVIVHG